MTVDAKLLEILVCPTTKVPVRRLPKDKLSVLNRAIADGGVKQMDGSPVSQELQEALVTEDNLTIYPVDDGIPVMLGDAGIATEQFPHW